MTAISLPIFKPLGLGELLDQAFRLYRRNFVRFIGIIATVQVPLVIIQLLTSLLTTRNLTSPVLDQPFSESFMVGGVVFIIVIVLSLVLVQGMATGALTRMIAEERMGREIGILEAYRKILPLLPRLLGTMLLFAVFILGLFVWTLVPCVGWISGAGMLIFAGMVLSQVLAPVVVLEDRWAGAAIRRAWELVRRRFWWVLGFMGALVILSYLIVAGPAMIITFSLTALLRDSADLVQANTITTVVNSLTSLITTLLYQPLQLTAVTLLYFDLRVRTEGLDLAIEAQRESGEPVDLATINAQTADTTGESIVTGKELGYFILLTVGVLAVYFALVMLLMIFSVVLAAMFGGF